jgi:hypothetical protein
VDAGLHHLQGKAERVRTAELLTLLQGLYRDKVALHARHEAAARRLSSYEINNTYQYILAREAVHLEWLRAAIEELGGSIGPIGPGASDAEPRDQSDLIRADVASAQAFVDAWRDRVEAVTHARHRTMLRVLLGEVLEHKRFFEQALAGRADLLGRRPPNASTGGGVLPDRWIG